MSFAKIKPRLCNFPPGYPKCSLPRNIGTPEGINKKKEVKNEA